MKTTVLDEKQMAELGTAKRHLAQALHENPELRENDQLRFALVYLADLRSDLLRQEWKTP